MAAHPAGMPRVAGLPSSHVTLPSNLYLLSSLPSPLLPSHLKLALGEGDLVAEGDEVGGLLGPLGPRTYHCRGNCLQEGRRGVAEHVKRWPAHTRLLLQIARGVNRSALSATHLLCLLLCEGLPCRERQPDICCSHCPPLRGCFLSDIHHRGQGLLHVREGAHATQWLARVLQARQKPRAEQTLCSSCHPALADCSRKVSNAAFQTQANDVPPWPRQHLGESQLAC